jgi:RNA polymerase sigma-70 factor, ECF subfamily
MLHRVDHTDPANQDTAACSFPYAAAALSDHPFEPSDEALLWRIGQADDAALAALYQRHARSARALASRLLADPTEAEDVVQDVFLTLWGRPCHFDPDRGTGRSWLLRVVRNRTLDRLRRRARHHGEDGLDTVQDERALSALEALDDAVDSRELWTAVEGLPGVQRDLIWRTYVQGSTHQQLAAELGLPLGTVKSRIRLGIEKLRSQFVAAA